MGGPSCAPKADPKGGAGLTFDVGYLISSRAAVLDITAEGAVPGGTSQFTHRYPVEGLWLALSADGRVGDLGVFARGSWLVPANRLSEEFYLFSGATGHRNWSTKIQWYNGDIAGLYPAYGGVSGIGGFRFDSFSTNFGDPAGVSPNFTAARPGDEADLTMTAYIPYVGLVVNLDSVVKFGLIGFPWVPGTVKYSSTFGGTVPGGLRYEASGNLKRSYFLETFAEFGTQVMGGYAGIFGILTYLHTAADVDLDRLGVAVPTSVSYTLTHDRQNWILGGKFALSFNLPYIPY